MNNKNLTIQQNRRLSESGAIGAIDMGSKSFKFVLGRKQEGQVLTELIKKERLGIGKEVTENHGIIGEKKCEEIDNALVWFKQYCQERGAETVIAVATSAIRNARNRQRIIDLAHRSNIEIEIADGVREGVIGYFAATGGAPNRVVSDSGSRSIQIAWESQGTIHSRSTPVGYEHVYEIFVEHADSMMETEEGFNRFLDGNFSELPTTAVELISLAANTLTTFVTGMERTDRENRYLQRSSLERKLIELRELTETEYIHLKSSLDDAEKILPGLVFLTYLMRRTNMQRALVAEAELPVGLIVEHFLKTESA